MVDSKLITYRNYKDDSIPILTIKKGTLLFRSVPEPERFISDYLGIPGEKGYCLPYNYNVFFSLCPYVFDTNMYFNREIKDKNPHVGFYILIEDVKVVLMVKPSTIVRAQEEKSNLVSTSCENFTFCDGLKGRAYDPCFYDDFLKENLDIHGMIAIQEKDADNFVNRYYGQKRFEPFRKFVNLVKDQKSIGSPELILYPRKIRTFEEIKTDLKSLDFSTYYQDHISEFIYYPLEIFKHNTYDSDDEMYTSLIKLLSPDGMIIDDQLFHLTIDKRTYFYTIQEEYEESQRSYLLPSNEENKLKIFRNTNKDFIFNHFKPKPIFKN